MACEFSPSGEAEELNLMKDEAKLQLVGHEEEVEKGTPVKYVPLCDLYSATSPCTGGASGSSNVMSKKVKARKINHFEGDERKKVADVESEARPPVIHFYSRKRRRPKPSFFESLVASPANAAAPQVVVKLEEGGMEESVKKKRRKIGKCELIKLEADSAILDVPRLGKFKNFTGSDAGKWSVKSRKNGEVDKNELSMVNSGSIRKKKWVRLSFDGADPRKFVGLQCQVYWPLDADWYYGRVVGYNPETGRHHVKYKDGDDESLILSNERVRFCISLEDMQDLKLSFGLASSESDVHDINEMVALAASLDDSLEELEPGNIIWAKLTGHAMWPAIVLDDSFAHDQKGLKRILGGKSVLVQFFGTHDFARIRTKQIMSFLRGLLSSFHLKCKKSNFVRSLEEAKIYLSEQKLSERMLCLQNGIKADNCESSGGEGENSADLDDDSMRNQRIQRKVGGLKNGPFETGDLQELSFSTNFRLFSKTSKLGPGRYHDMPVGYRPVNVKWKDLDKCNVCHMDEEYENNLFLQCDKCRMMVHARCYGEVEPVDGILWLCNLCRPGAPEFPPPCCLCPVIGGAMKPTTDGRWAHLACAIWIPETCLADIKKMEPIDGLSRINKDRWKLLCSICEVSYGACIQCSNNSCCVAYHPLCARVAGFCVELEDEDRLPLTRMDEDEEDQCIRLLSYCKKHRLPSNDRLATDDRIGQIVCQPSDYNPPSNPSGCARCEPYNYFGRRGRKEPEALAAASLKRLFVENRPYLVGGYSQHQPFQNMVSSSSVEGSRFSFSVQRLKAFQLDASKSIGSMTEKYNYMRETFRKRLAFGKSGIHGFGIFAKIPHRAGDMVIEYTGELVRPPIADRREHLIYNSLVGAGTYMFRIDDERVIDATRAGSIAHLINHSCEPNCYSRTISVNGDEHIIIFAKRDIKQWEELTYDYRFFSIDEKLACYCGFSSCRGIVNDFDSGERVAKVYAPCSELTAWEGD